MEIRAASALLTIAFLAACGIGLGGTGDEPAPSDDAAALDADAPSDALLDLPPSDDAEADTPPADGPPAGRVTRGLIALYTFDEGGASAARDTSGVNPPLDLAVPQSPAVSWGPGLIVFNAPAIVTSTRAAAKIVSRCQASGEITLEAWFRYGPLPGFCRVVDVTASADVGNVAMTSDATTIGFDLRTASVYYGRHTIGVFDAGPSGRLVHLVETRSADMTMRIILDGAEILHDTQAGSFAGWDATMALSLGNTPALDRPFYGELHLVAIYDRALTDAEIATNRALGPDPP